MAYTVLYSSPSHHYGLPFRTSLIPIPARPHTVLLHRQDHLGTSLAVQQLRLCSSTAGSVSSILGWGAMIPHAMKCGQTKIGAGGGGKRHTLYSQRHPNSNHSLHLF